ncbi:Cytochrome P450 [Botryosphaeria dothidea]|uniref:Cytochrome P450 n=1 Tax=Botryosphaeria dothidea TaxID=55169 RepID=A0A8H4IPA2_9PEZI|nr:Cytochrome P450 [Botryosphaeria dothidea]
MALDKVVASSLLSRQYVEILSTLTVLFLSYGLYSILTSQRPYPNIPLVGAEGGNGESKKRYSADGVGVVKRAMKQCRGVCQIITDDGPKILLPRAYLGEIKDGKGLSFAEFIREDLLANYKGFEALHVGLQDGVFSEVVRVKLTQSLTRLPSILSEEASVCIDDLLPSTPDWTTTDPFHSVALQIVARVTSRAFLGESLCKNKEWLRISIEFTKDIFSAIPVLRKYPPFLRPLVRPFLREVKCVMAHQAAATRIIEPELQRRREEREQQARRGEKPEKPLDSLQWIEEVSASKSSGYDVVIGQLSMSIASIHTTSAALTNIMFDLVAHPDLTDDVRAEIVQVLGPHKAGEWEKSTLFRFRLMDSVLKESQRMNPTGALSMRRRASAPLTLSNGTKIPAGAMMAVPTLPMWDGDLYANPDEYDGRRFLKLREQPGHENRWQFVTTAPDVYAFGHVKHACPGRFFASNELKVVLMHLLMKYDWRFAGGKQGVEARPKTVVAVESFRPDPTVRLEYRARTSEIDL